MQQIVRTLMMPVSSVYANLVAYGVKRRRLPDAHQDPKCAYEFTRLVSAV